MASVTPTIQVLLDDGTGTYPIDITSRVSLANVGVSGYGRGDEFSQATAASLSLILKNDDGGLSVDPGFGLGPFGGGPFGGGGPTVYPGQGIRYKETKGATTVNAFTGRISELPLGWTGGNAKSSQVNLVAVDPLAALALRPLRSMIEQEVLLRSPSQYYTLGEAEGSTSAGDSSGNQATPMTIDGTGVSPVFGSGIGPGSDGLPAATFAGGKFLSLPDIVGSAPTSYGVGVWFTIAALPATTQVLRLDSGWSLQMNTAGNVLASGPWGFTPTGSVNLADGRLHFAVIASSSGLATLYVDGVAAAAPVAVTAGGRAGFHTIGGFPGSTTITGTLSHVATWPAGLTAADVLAIYSAGIGLIETTAARFARIASYVGATTSTPVNSGVLMAAQSTSGVSAADALQAVAAAEGGVMFANGSGTLVLQGHGYRAQKTTPTLTVPMKDVSASTALTWDTQQIVNQVTAARTGGAAQVVNNASSIAAYGLYAQSLDLALAADSDALSAAQWLVNKHSSPVQRIGTVSVNLLTSAIAAQIMAVEIGDRWSLSGMPTQAWSGFGDLSVEGYSRTLVVTDSGAEWSMTLNLLPWSLFQSGIYDYAGSLYDAAVYA